MEIINGVCFKFISIFTNKSFYVITLHLISERGRNKHHIIEATFKAFAVALRRALVKNEKLGIPSTKGVL